jgi:rubrerythrin
LSDDRRSAGVAATAPAARHFALRAAAPAPTFTVLVAPRADDPEDGAMTPVMTIEEAIKTAIAYEKKVHGAYADAVKKAKDPTAVKVFEVMAKEELGHIAYLESRLAEWQKRGQLTPEKLGTILPSKEKVEAGIKKLKGTLKKKTTGATPELGFLQQALAMEEETSAFYKRMVAELPPEGQQLFGRFLEIEDGHAVIVQAEIDSVTGMGFWFDVMEFSLEGG